MGRVLNVDVEGRIYFDLRAIREMTWLRGKAVICAQAFRDRWISDSDRMRWYPPDPPRSPSE
jgi:hypothetical protein